MFEPGHYTYRVPTDVIVRPVAPRRVLLVASCLFVHWPPHIYRADPGCHCDYVVFNNVAELPKQPPQPIGDYDLQIVQLPLRSVVWDGAFAALTYDDLAGYERIFEQACTRVSVLLRAAMRWNEEHGLLTLVTNFLTPQQSNVGRLLPRYDLRNFQHFVERLNIVLEQEVRSYQNAFLCDIDAISATFGRRHFQDDGVWPDNHCSLLNDVEHPFDQARFEPLPRMSDRYPIEDRPVAFMDAVWAEALAMFRTARQVDAIKLVIFDVDDTLWRGVLAETDARSGMELEGWPLGVFDALTALKKRGILVALASKNEDSRFAQTWEQVVGSRFPLTSFAVCKVNWQTKVANIREILAGVNLLPKSVLFVDDNPVERAAVTAAYPEMRVVGADPYSMKRILTWSAELQVPAITAESTARTEMIQGQFQRETARARVSREEFLRSLSVTLIYERLTSETDTSFARAFELLNKTNQFNTTGERWTHERLKAAFAAGAWVLAWRVEDVYSKYGLVGAAIINDNCIQQFVMSCRVLGLGVEEAAIAGICRRLHGEFASVRAIMRPTEANSVCRDLYERTGFVSDGDDWVRDLADAVRVPEHVTVLG